MYSPLALFTHSYRCCHNKELQTDGQKGSSVAVQTLRALFSSKEPLTSPPSPAIHLEIIWAGEARFPLSQDADECKRTSSLLFVSVLNRALMNPQKTRLFRIEWLQPVAALGSVQLRLPLTCSCQEPGWESRACH